jgi:hypothetical protein
VFSSPTIGFLHSRNLCNLINESGSQVPTRRVHFEKHYHTGNESGEGGGDR